MAALGFVVLSACGGAVAAGHPGQSLARVAGTACLKPILATAVVVEDDLLLTVAHAVAGSEPDLAVIDSSGTERIAVVVAFDPERDLALLQAEGFKEAIELAAPQEGAEGTIAAVDSDLVVKASPYRIIRLVTASLGDIYDQGQFLRQVIEIEADVSPGDSGAPLLDGSGEMVGMIFATSEGVEESAWATHVSEIETFLGSPRSGDDVDRGRCR